MIPFMSLNWFLCFHTHSTFVKFWSLQFFFFFHKRSYIYLVFALCSVAVISILVQLCFAMLGSRVTLYPSGSFARFGQRRTLAGDEEGEGREAFGPLLTHFFLLFFGGVVSLEGAVSLPLLQLFKSYPPPLFLLLRWQLVPRWGLPSWVQDLVR